MGAAANLPRFGLIRTVLDLEGSIDKLTAALPQERRELFLRLMVALDVEEGNPLLPIFVGLQVYIEYLKTVLGDIQQIGIAYKEEIPAEIRVAADDSLRKALSAYRDIQGRIDKSAGHIDTSVDRIDSIREQWREEMAALVPDIQKAYSLSMQDALAAYRASSQQIAEDSLSRWSQELVFIRKSYLQDVLKQGLIWASGVVLIALLIVAGAANWQGRQAATQGGYGSFGGVAMYNFSQQLMNRPQNLDRLVNCRSNGQSECTVWIEDPP